MTPAGAKSIGLYGGYESFILNLLQQHKDNKYIKYHVACKANGDGYMDLEKLPGATSINRNEFSYCNAHCFMIHVPEKIGSAQAIYYDINALRWCCEHIEKNHIEKPIVYILASRIGPFEKRYVKRIHISEKYSSALLITQLAIVFEERLIPLSLKDLDCLSKGTAKVYFALRMAASNEGVTILLRNKSFGRFALYISPVFFLEA